MDYVLVFCFLLCLLENLETTSFLNIYSLEEVIFNIFKLPVPRLEIVPENIKVCELEEIKKLETFLELHNYKYWPYSNEYSTKNIPFVGKNLHLSFFQLQIGKKSNYHAAHLSVIGDKGILANLTKVQMPKLFDYKGKKHPCIASLA